MNIALGPPTRLGRLAMVCGVLAIIFGLVSAVSAAPQPGSTCKVAGRERVTTVGTLRCTKNSGRSLRWVQVAPPPTTTTMTSSTTTTVAASARAPQVSAVSADDSRVRFTLSGMSPDTGVYSVQWVERGSSFNTYQMVRATSRDVAISSQTFRCDRTYTFRVFVMGTGWTLADGHSFQNVTPHSEPFNVTMTHACAGSGTAPITTTTVAATSCADGGTCAVGDSGPGGGIVFYVHPSGTFSCGGALTSTCKYLEAAPTSGSSSWTDSEYKWSGEEYLPVGTNARGTAIGTGYRNTLAIVNQNSTASRAGTISRSYRGPNSQSDWYLPSQDELNELCKFARRQTTGVTATLCDGSGSLRSGFAVNYYWSSTEIYRNPTYSDAWLQDFSAGSQIDDSKQFPRSVRPIRAFGGTLACADGGTCAVGDTGPGGGIVFILASTAGNTTGLTFEAARNDWDGASPDGTARWCSASNASIPGLGTAIGTGSSNSATIATTCTSTGALDAAEYVRGKTIGGKNDWFLPSRDEALQIYAQRSVFTGNYAINELTADTARYLTSSQGTNVLNSLGAYLQGSSFPGTSQDLSKNFNFSVRPVRSFTAGS